MLFSSSIHSNLSQKLHKSDSLQYFSAMAATIVKAYMMRDIEDQVDITWSWAPITMWYT